MARKESSVNNKDLTPYARELRKNMTKEERHLWYDFLRDYPVKFVRQKILKKYIVDFYCPEYKIVIELDGSQHYEDDGPEKDRERTRYLVETFGVEVIRFQNVDVNESFEGVCMEIDRVVKRKAGAGLRTMFDETDQ